jgi:outer membrane protein OmpA-like peptidoglycan-associated protein
MLAMKWAFSFFMLVFMSGTGYAQNLVLNGGFEEYTVCPGSFHQNTQEFKVPHWFTANTGTPDHFHACSAGEADVPSNWAGVSEAYEGNGYAGLYVWIDRAQNHYREYIETKLTEELKKDSVYVIAFRFRLSSYSTFSIDRMGCLLGDSAVVIKHDQAFFDSIQLHLIRDSALTQQTGLWEEARWNYRASGGEQYLTIGNFFNNQLTKTYKIKSRPVQQEMLAAGSYYYIDDVRVVPMWQYVRDSLAQAEQVLMPQQVVLNKNYVLKNIQFEFDSYKLIPPSFDELDKIVTVLSQNRSWRIYVEGHTDDRGSELYNLRLSQNRANSVALYLISQGIQKERIITRGYGKSKPIRNEVSETARLLNRRVECRFEN